MDEPRFYNFVGLAFLPEATRIVLVVYGETGRGEV